MTTDDIQEVSEKGPARRRPPARAGCPHDGSELVLSGNPAKPGRVYCVQCACSFLFGDQVTQGAGCSYSPSEATATPTVASE